jgi:hypothetical protein
MKKQYRLKNRKLTILVSGLLVGLLSMGLFVSAALAAPTSQLFNQNNPDLAHQGMAQEEKGCADCHPNVETTWIASPHAHAFDDKNFMDRWASLGKPGECLACHTTGYQSTTNTFVSAGVQCQACHGEAVEGHPPAVVPVEADTDYCGACHTTTLSEWRLTGHATAGVGCIDCHDPHIQKDIGCVDCHALVIPPDSPPEDGIVPTGHAFTITPDTCVACHTDALHAGFSLPGYENGAKAANGGEGTGEGTEQANIALEESMVSAAEAPLTSEQRIQALEAALASARLSTLFQGGIIGIVFGGITVYYLARNRRQNAQDIEVDQGNEEDIHSSDDDLLDEQLEKVLVSVENFIGWVKSRIDSRTNKVPKDKRDNQDDHTPKSS